MSNTSASPVRRGLPPIIQEFPEEPTMAQAISRLAAAVEAHTEAAAPAFEVVAGFGDRLDGLCNFLRTKGPWILASVPGVLMAIGAITPQVADALQKIIVNLGS